MGGEPQWISVRGNARGPLLLFLHGGPGSAEEATARRHQRAWEAGALVVNWDQRGAGRSYRRGVPLSLEKLVEDAGELCGVLLERFRRDRLTLVGHSWGSALAFLVASEYPARVRSVVTAGQLVAGEENERVSYAWLQARAASSPLARAIRDLPPPPYGGNAKRLLRQRAWLGLFGGFFKRRRDALRYGLHFAASRDYGWRDKRNYVHGSRASLSALWPSIEALDLYKLVPKLHVPIHVCLGRSDWTTPSELAEIYINRLEAPEKTVHWFDKSAHFPHLEEPQRFLQVLHEATR